MIQKQCGFCRDCKFCKPDFEFEEVLICKNENLKIQVVFSFEGGTLSVEPDFGCVQFENRIADVKSYENLEKEDSKNKNENLKK